MSFYADVNSSSPTIRPEVTDARAIAQSVRNLVSYRRGERPFEPEFGIDIIDYLFELMDDSASLQVFTDISDAITRFEPRVKIDNRRSLVTADPDTYTFTIDIYFEIIGFEEDGTFRLTEQIAA